MQPGKATNAAPETPGADIQTRPPEIAATLLIRLIRLIHQLGCPHDHPLENAPAAHGGPAPRGQTKDGFQAPEEAQWPGRVGPFLFIGLTCTPSLGTMVLPFAPKKASFTDDFFNLAHIKPI